MMEHILSLITFSPLLGVLLLLFVPKDKAGTIKLIGVLVTLIPLVLALTMFASFDASVTGPQFVEDTNWFDIALAGNGSLQFNYTMGVDGLSMPLVALATIVAAMSAIAAVNMIDKRWKEYFIFFFLMQVGLYGVFTSQTLFLFFIFFEISLVTMFFLIGVWGGEKREDAAFTFLLYNGLGSAIMLISFVVLIVNAGQIPGSGVFTSDLQTITSNLANFGDYSSVFTYGVFFALLVAFGIKLPLFPFHSWILKVHYQAPPPMSMILSGVLLKIGAYGLMRMEVGFFPSIAEEFSTLLIVLGIVNLLYGGILAYVQEDFKMVVVYSSISHMGIILMGIGAMNRLGFQGALFQMVSHGFLSAIFFFIVGVIYVRTHTAKFEDLGGMAKVMPFTSGILLTAGMASLGLPGMSGFISEFLSFLGLFQNHAVLAAVGTIGIVLTSAYLLRAILNVTYGPTKEILVGMVDARLTEVIPMMILLGFIILIGVYPTILSDPIQTTLQSLLTRIGG